MVPSPHSQVVRKPFSVMFWGISPSSLGLLKIQVGGVVFSLSSKWGEAKALAESVGLHGYSCFLLHDSATQTSSSCLLATNALGRLRDTIPVGLSTDHCLSHSDPHCCSQGWDGQGTPY